MIPVKVYGVGMNPGGGGGFVVLLMDNNNRQCLPIFVGGFEAQAIAMELENAAAPRPLTHDLFKNVLIELGYKIQKVYINELRDRTFYARLFVDNGKDTYEIDARPSDSIALAVRFRAPIYVDENVMQTSAVDQEKVETDETKQIQELNEELNRAVDNEEFERAAEIRDMIKELKKKLNLPDEIIGSDEKPTN